MIYQDSREPKRIKRELEKLGLKVQRKFMQVSDYAFGGFRIERKTTTDLLGSIYSGRIYEQLYNLQQAEKPVLIVVGNIPPATQWIHAGNRKIPRPLTYEEQLRRYKTIRENMITAYTSYNVQVFHALDEKDFCHYLAGLYYKSTKKGTKTRKLKRKSKSLENIKIDILGSIPGIGISLATTLAKSYTIRRLFNMSTSDLEKIKNIGSKTAKKIVECVSK